MAKKGTGKDTPKTLLSTSKTQKEKVSGSRKRIDYRRQFIKRDRAVKIMKELSDFLKILDLNESEILHTMLVRFAIESVEATQGSLLQYDLEENRLKYRETYFYENNKISLENPGEMLQDTTVRPGEGIVGEAYLKATPILVEDINKSNYPKPLINEKLNIDVRSVIAMPLMIQNDVVSVLEIANGPDKPKLTMTDVEVIMIIANFASTILYNARLYSWAIHDSMTGLYNNHYFSKELNDKIDQSKRYGRIFSLVMFDIDNFKHINDEYKHITGDKALKLVSECIQKTIRKEVDIAARYGGDEFVIVLPNTTADEAFKVCMRLSNLVKNSTVISSDGREVGVTLSIGISEFPQDGEEAYYLFNHADEALYESKRAGRDAITIYGRKTVKSNVNKSA